MDIGTAMSVVQTLLAALECSLLKDFCSKESLSSQIDQLKVTVKRIQGVLEEAEFKHALSKHEEAYLDELKDVVYEADDLFDEFLTLAHQRKLNDGVKNRLLSLFTKLKKDNNISQKVDSVKQKLDNIAYNNQLINFKHDLKPIEKRSRETCSYVPAVSIIGRDADLDKIVHMLLQSDGSQPVSFLSIVGIGGLGKTALAQLVFNDPRLETAFPLKMWTCVSDQDQNDFDEKQILRKILEAATKNSYPHASMEQLQKQLCKQLKEDKYLLVLDDVWTEKVYQWRKLANFLMESKMGSWILVTTRSQVTATIIGDGLKHELKGLSKENSWHLFERAAFGSNQSNPFKDLINIGQKIVERCSNVPLAINVAGSLLYGQDKRKWLSFQELPLTEFEEKNSTSEVMPVLKLSYHHLESPLKSCFAYCALFPKGYKMQKKILMRLWIAQGYIQSGGKRSVENIAEEYFSVLLQRCFFQDIEEDEYGDIDSCRMHDLMHDVAQEIVGGKCYSGNGIPEDERVRHIFTSRKEHSSYTFHESCTRSFLQVDRRNHCIEGTIDQLSREALIANWKYLRVLDLSDLKITTLPSTIGELLHLRYLDLSWNSFLKKLPNQIIKLYNLQTLDMKNCQRLEELPKEMSKLVKLRALDIQHCDQLKLMPTGMGSLSNLQELTMFVVGKSDCSGLEDLRALTNLKGDIEIKCGFEIKDENEKESTGCLSNKPHLTSVYINMEKCDRRLSKDKGIIEKLQPNCNLKALKVYRYGGVRMPTWATDKPLANLVKMHIMSCEKLGSLGCLGTLHHLKFLYLSSLKNMRWLIEETNTSTSERDGERGSEAKAEEEFSFFPSLETLHLNYLPELRFWKRLGMGDNDRQFLRLFNLKGFDRGKGMEDNQQQFLRLPKLKQLRVDFCQKLAAVVECPSLEDLVLNRINEESGIIRMKKIEKKERGNGDGDGKHNIGEGTNTPNIPKLRKISVDNLGWLHSQHIHMKEVYQCLQSLVLSDHEVKSLGQASEVFLSCSSSLRSLRIQYCRNLESVYGGLQHLTALDTLKIIDCSNLSFECCGSGSGSGMPWRSLNHSLRTLTLSELPQLVNLPNWIQFLSALQTLEISDCENLQRLPSWLPKLTSLRELSLIRCSEGLQERCHESTGEDFLYIKHIPSRAIY